MNLKKLPQAAEDIRLRIKGMIPELSPQSADNWAEVLKTEENGNKTYGGHLLMEQISFLSEQLPIPDPTNWGWRLLYCAVPTKLRVGNRGFLIPLSERTLRDAKPPDGRFPADRSQEGFYIEFTTDPEVNSRIAVIVFVPK